MAGLAPILFENNAFPYADCAFYPKIDVVYYYMFYY